MKPKSAKAKGRNLQDKVKDDLVKQLNLNPKEVKKAIMGESGPDVVFRNFIAECTNTEYLRIWEKLAQLNRHIEKADIPNPFGVLIFKKNRSETYATIKWDDLLALMTRIKQLKKELKTAETKEEDSMADKILLFEPSGGSC